VEIAVFDLGLVDFFKAREFQKEIFGRVRGSAFPGALILCRHYPVITLGRASRPDSVVATPRELKERGIPVYEIERGGDATYHGPGQVTAYPVLDLRYFKKDIHWFLRQLEEAVIGVLSDYGLSGSREPGRTGVWVNGDKIASIGIAIRHWITFHGVSVNVKKEDQSNFGLIRPCGMDITMTCMEAALGREVDTEDVKNNLMRHCLKGGKLYDESNLAGAGRGH
jgi:lipoyl(octanoyl) transferase